MAGEAADDIKEPESSSHQRPDNPFPDESKWPMLGRDSNLREGLAYLQPETPKAESRLLIVRGQSGIGKSFFVKELLCRFASAAPECIALYIDVDESEFESSEFTKRLSVLASYPSIATRANPSHVPADASLAKYLRPLPFGMKLLHWAYTGAKESAKLIPYAGKGVSAFMPGDLPQSRERESAVGGKIWDYLVAEAAHRPVLLIVDNVQFLTESLALEIDSGLSTADKGFRLVLVERLKDQGRSNTPLRCFPLHRLELDLKPLSWAQVSELVRGILGRTDPEIDAIGEAVYRRSEGNPKQIWLQLRNLRLGSMSPENAAGYDETILSLSRLDKLALQLVTLLMGGLKLDDIVGILRWIVQPLPEEEIRQAIVDLSIIGLLVINGPTKDRIRTEHELVRLAVRRVTTEQEALQLRDQTIAAIRERLDRAPDTEYERLIDRLMGLLSAEELRLHPDFLSYLIDLVDRQKARENYHYLCSLYSSICSVEVLRLLPRHSALTFLDAFQKTSQFDKGLAAIESIRTGGRVPIRDLDLFATKYLVQKFDYTDAEQMLKVISEGSDRDVVLFNILLNLEKDDQARGMIEALGVVMHLDEPQCVMLRNSAHLYEPDAARRLLNRGLDGFKNLGLQFGVATANNNLGLIELWTGNHSEAERLLGLSLGQLEKLSSNEAYQPMSNISVLRALQGDWETAKRMVDSSKATVSRRLFMDELMLTSNELVIGLARGATSIDEVAVKIRELSDRSLQTKDLRFRRAMEWLAVQLEAGANGETENRKGEGFFERCRAIKLCGLEVFHDLPVEDGTVTVLLHLSPHWRY